MIHLLPIGKVLENIQSDLVAVLTRGKTFADRI